MGRALADIGKRMLHGAVRSRGLPGSGNRASDFSLTKPPECNDRNRDRDSREYYEPSVSGRSPGVFSGRLHGAYAGAKASTTASAVVSWPHWHLKWPTPNKRMGLPHLVQSAS